MDSVRKLSRSFVDSFVELDFVCLVLKNTNCTPPKQQKSKTLPRTDVQEIPGPLLATLAACSAAARAFRQGQFTTDLSSFTSM